MKGFSFVCSVLCLVTGIPAWSQTNQGTQADRDQPGLVYSQNETITPSHPITPQEAQELSGDAAALLRHVSKARDELVIKNPGGALHQVDQAQTMMDIIRSGMPTLRIKDRIDLARQDLKKVKSEEVMDDLVPIYSDIATSMDELSSKNARMHLDRAKQALKNNDKAAAQNELKAAAESITVAQVDLPLDETQRNLTSAMLALEKGRAKDADHDLANIQKNLQVNFATVAGEPVNQPNLMAPHARTQTPGTQQGGTRGSQSTQGSQG